MGSDLNADVDDGDSGDGKDTWEHSRVVDLRQRDGCYECTCGSAGETVDAGFEPVIEPALASGTDAEKTTNALQAEMEKQPAATQVSSHALVLVMLTMPMMLLQAGRELRLRVTRFKNELRSDISLAAGGAALDEVENRDDQNRGTRRCG